MRGPYLFGFRCLVVPIYRQSGVHIFHACRSNSNVVQTLLFNLIITRMKKLFVLVVILMGCYNAFGQKVYCELVGTQATPLSKAAISVDFGQRMRGDVLVDDEGKPLKFNSMIDAMNYMAQRGWEFEAAYPVGKGDLTYHWLLSKTITNGKSITDGFTTKRQFKEARKDAEPKPQQSTW